MCGRPVPAAYLTGQDGTVHAEASAGVTGTVVDVLQSGGAVRVRGLGQRSGLIHHDVKQS